MAKTGEMNTQTSDLFGFFNEIGIISQLATNMFEERLPDDMTSAQFVVLNWFVRVDDVATPTRLAKAFQVTGGAMTNTLKRLSAKGYVDIRPDPNSGRQKIITMTKQGRKARDTAIQKVAPLLQEFAGAFSPEELNRTTRKLAKVRQYLDEYRYSN